MRATRPNHIITSLLLLGMLLINVFIVIPETEKNENLMSIDLQSAYGMPSSIIGLLYVTCFLYLMGIVYCLSGLDDKLKILQNDEEVIL